MHDVTPVHTSAVRVRPESPWQRRRRSTVEGSEYRQSASSELGGRSTGILPGVGVPELGGRSTGPHPGPWRSGSQDSAAQDDGDEKDDGDSSPLHPRGGVEMEGRGAGVGTRRRSRHGPEPPPPDRAPHRRMRTQPLKTPGAWGASREEMMSAGPGAVPLRS